MNDKFIYAPLEIVTDSRLTYMQTRVLLALLSFRNKNTNLVWPKRKTLCELLGYTESNLSRVTKQLVDLGWLQKEGDGGRSMAVRYLVTVPEIYEPENSKTVAKQETVAELETVSNSATKTVASLARGKEDTNEDKENINIHTREILKNGFDEFWKIYPKKKSKADAEKAWNKLNPDEQLQQTIIAAVILATTQDATWTKDDGQFIPHPASWLRGERWKDEITKKSQSSDRAGSDSGFNNARGNYGTNHANNETNQRNRRKLSLASQTQRDAGIVEQQERRRYERVIN